MKIFSYTGGIFDTNAFLIESTDRSILIDAPQGAAEWLEESGQKVDLLLLTHGHVDHVFDAAAIKRQYGCPIACHKDTVPMVSDPDFFRNFGFALEVETVEADLLLEETPSKELGGIDFSIYLVPGHCPGSLCFLAKEESILFGGDVLFAGGVGRWDLPGGDYDQLISGIREKLLTLGDDVKVLPGHGPVTTIGRERKTNPFLT